MPVRSVSGISSIVATALVALVSGCLCPCVGPPAGPPAFTLRVVPEGIDDTIPGQQCVLLVTVEEDDPAAAAEPVTVTATASGATATVANGTIVEGQVAEVTVTMLPPQDGQEVSADGQPGLPCSATVRAIRGDVVRQIEVPITLTSDEQDLLAPAAAEMRDLFIDWLAANRPELGIDESTDSDGTIVKPHWLVVSHYLFFSDAWEMHVSWHVMIAPHDWARIELRRRFAETLPSLAFEIESVSADEPLTVTEIQPEGVLWR